MYVIRWSLLKSCIFGVFISVTEASVLLQTFDRETTYIKGSNVTLVCTITPYNNVMTWYVDNQLYADCFLGNCGPSLNKPYTFKFTFDETAGVFKLNIDSVDSSHEGLSFACDDGNVRETISFNVTTDKGKKHSTTSTTSKSPTNPDINNQKTVTSEHNNDNGDSPVSTGGIIGIVFGIVVLLILVACLIIFVYRWKKVTEMENKICDVKKVLDTMQPKDKQTLYLGIVNEENQIIQELENRKGEINRSSWERQGSSEERQDRNTTQLESIKAQVVARKTLFRLEGAEHAQNIIIHKYIDKVETRNRFFSLQDPVSYRIFSRVIMEDIKRIKREKDDQMKLIGQLVTRPQRSKEEVHSTMIREL